MIFSFSKLSKYVDNDVRKIERSRNDLCYSQLKFVGEELEYSILVQF